MTKILCPDGVERHIDELRNSEFENYPKVVLAALLAGQKPRKKKSLFTGIELIEAVLGSDLEG